MKLPVPQSALSQHVIALGKTRSGKSSKMRLIVESILDEEKPVCIIDPKGDWWGIRSTASGARRGYPVVIFGGEHADVPLNAHGGAAVAELIATGNRPALIDLGGWMIGERTRFFIDFASTFFKLTRGHRYLVIDEVHNFAPQGKVFDVDAGKMLHWANRLASEGAGKGVTLIAASQRPQKVHKDFVTSCETLIACRVVHKLDRDAIKDWIDGCADPERGREVLGTLASMQRQEAWVWSPEIDFGPKRITWPMFSTYDSFKPQAARVSKLKGWADVDLADVRSKLDSAIKEAESNDPKRLRARIVELERQVKALPEATADFEALHAQEKAGFERGVGVAREAQMALLASLQNKIGVALNACDLAVAQIFETAKPFAPAKAPLPPRRPPPARAPARPVAPPPPRASGNGEASEPPSVRKILEAFHKAYPVSLSFEAAARRAAISSRSSAYRKYREAIAASAELEQDGDRYRSRREFAQAGSLAPGAGVEQWVAKLPPTYGKMLSAIYHDGPLDKPSIAARAGVSPTSSGLGSGLNELVRLSLVTKEGEVYRIAEGLD